MTDKRQGITSLFLVILISLLVIVGGYYYFKPSNKNLETKENIIQQTEKAENEVVNEDQYKEWQEYINERYNYKIKYPPTWYFVKEGYSPPPPTTVLFSNQEKSYAQSNDYVFVEISMDLKLDRTLDTIGEVMSLKEQGYDSEKIKFAGVDAIYLYSSKGDIERSKVNSIYFIQSENIYRINYGGETSEVKDKNTETFKKILDMFSFLK